ncbi:hypothetical protein QJS10_CPA03g00182 [Acorus calamus]|uniref:Uncharacterized protein n=1 Tax=Acorus calamus TaxID=4465 RepID=A0AAV9F4F2_ACOCL|nr:hypothetical protein QJS10_CPA03g00182 [Acorus calamus]
MSSSRLFDSFKPGERIAFGDGKIWVSPKDLKGPKLGSEKPINILHSEVQLEGLTSKVIVDPDFVTANADMVWDIFYPRCL